MKDIEIIREALEEVQELCVGATYRKTEEALSALDRMEQAGDGPTYNELLTALSECLHGPLSDDETDTQMLRRVSDICSRASTRHHTPRTGAEKSFANLAEIKAAIAKLHELSPEELGQHSFEISTHQEPDQLEQTYLGRQRQQEQRDACPEIHDGKATAEHIKGS